MNCSIYPNSGGRMVSYPAYKCWEVMDCDNLDCPARREPKIPCWEIARRGETYHNLSNTCRDCVVYMLNEERSIVSIQKLQNIMKLRKHLKNFAAGHQGCI